MLRNVVRRIRPKRAISNKYCKLNGYVLSSFKYSVPVFIIAWNQYSNNSGVTHCEHYTELSSVSEDSTIIDDNSKKLSLLEMLGC